MTTEREKMLAGELYDPLDAELIAAGSGRGISVRHSTRRARANKMNDAQSSATCSAPAGRHPWAASAHALSSREVPFYRRGREGTACHPEERSDEGSALSTV